MRYLTAFFLGAAFVFAIFFLFPWMKTNLEFSPQFRIDGGSGELAVTESSAAGGSNPDQSTKKAIESFSKGELEEQLAMAAARKLELAARERRLDATTQEIKEEQVSTDKLKRQIDELLIEKFSNRVLADGSMRSQRRLQTMSKASPEERHRLMVEAYQQMTPEGLAAVVQDLAKEDRTDGALSVLSVLEDRKAARVLALVAEPQPSLAASLTEQLRDGLIRVR